VNGQPETIEAKYEMFSPAEWDRFLRFMTRYVRARPSSFSSSQWPPQAEANGLSFNKA